MRTIPVLCSVLMTTTLSANESNYEADFSCLRAFAAVSQFLTNPVDKKKIEIQNENLRDYEFICFAAGEDLKGWVLVKGKGLAGWSRTWYFYYEKERLVSVSYGRSGGKLKLDLTEWKPMEETECDQSQ
jgi:hypothetical protein